jgi:hypothetical protein
VICREFVFSWWSAMTIPAQRQPKISPHEAADLPLQNGGIGASRNFCSRRAETMAASSRRQLWELGSEVSEHQVQLIVGGFLLPHASLSPLCHDPQGLQLSSASGQDVLQRYKSGGSTHQETRCFDHEMRASPFSLHPIGPTNFSCLDAESPHVAPSQSFRSASHPVLRPC